MFVQQAEVQKVGGARVIGRGGFSENIPPHSLESHKTELWQGESAACAKRLGEKRRVLNRDDDLVSKIKRNVTLVRLLVWFGTAEEELSPEEKQNRSSTLPDPVLHLLLPLLGSFTRQSCFMFFNPPRK